MQLIRILVFLTLRIMSRIVMIFVSSIFWVWVIIDIRTLFIIPFLAAESRPKKSWFTGVGVYFVVQFIGRVRILFAMVIDWAFSTSVFCRYVMCLGFSLKLGLVPLHFWVSRRFAYFHYGGIFVVGAGQKVFVIACVPMFSDVPFCAYLFYGMAVRSMLYGPVAMFNSILVKSFLAYSSVNHTGFLVITRWFGLHLIYLYSFIYCVRMIFLTWILWSGRCVLIKELGTDLPACYKTGFIATALRFSGFPPFLDFCTKYVVIQIAMEGRAFIAIFAVLASSLINLIVWIWVTSLATSSGIIRSLPPSSSLLRDIFNISCISWNLFRGMAFGMLY